MSDLPPGRDEELRRLRRWLAFSERLDRMIEASEAPARTVPATTVLASAPTHHARGLRAGLAVRLARVAHAVHPEAAAGVVRQGQAETSLSG